MSKYDLAEEALIYRQIIEQYSQVFGKNAVLIANYQPSTLTEGYVKRLRKVITDFSQKNYTVTTMHYYMFNGHLEGSLACRLCGATPDPKIYISTPIEYLVAHYQNCALNLLCSSLIPLLSDIQVMDLEKEVHYIEILASGGHSNVPRFMHKYTYSFAGNIYNMFPTLSLERWKQLKDTH